MINELRDIVHKNAIEKGFWHSGFTPNIPEKIALIHSELSECLEALRKDKFASKKHLDTFLYEDHSKESILLQPDKKFLFEQSIKNTFEDEMADVIIRCLDLCGYMNINIEAHILAKMEYNKTRPYKHGKSF